MFKSVVAGVVCAVSLGLMVSCDAQSHGAGGGMHRVSIDDPMFGASAYSLNIPSGWKFEGSIRHDVSCSPGDAFQTYRLTSPDGKSVISVRAPFFTAYPAQMIQGMNFNGCGVIAQFVPTGQLLTQYVIPQFAPQAHMEPAERLPNVDQWGEQLSFLPGIPDAQQDASRVKISYTEGGQAYEAWIVGLTLFKKVNAQGWGFSKTVIGTVRAPQGHLAEAEANLNWALKLSVNQAWLQQEENRMDQATAQSQARGAQTRQGIAADAQAHMNATNQWSQNTIDSIHRTGAASMKSARDSENARHAGAVGTADYVGDRPTNYYRWRNTVTGATQVTNNSTNPGPNWVPVN